MQRLIAAAVMVGLGFIGIEARAQQAATSVQLPTFSYFGVATTVSVPDRGGAYLGGVNRASGGMRQFGAPLLPFGNRSRGSSRGASGMSVSVWIHDHQAMDEALLAQPTPYRSALASPRQPDPWAQRLAAGEESTSGQAVASVEEIRRRQAAAAQTRATEAQNFFERGRKAEAEGKANVAKIYYQMVARRDSGTLKDEAIARLEALRGGAASVARREP